MTRAGGGGHRGATARRSGWQPVLVFMAVVFLLSLAAWGVFFKLSAGFDTKRLAPEQIERVLKHARTTNESP